MAIGTGHGATVSFGGAAVPKVRRIGGWTESADGIDATHLETTGTRDYVPPDLGELEGFEVERLWDSEATPPVLGASAQVIYTLKLNGGEVTPANYTGQAFYEQVGHPESMTNELMVVTDRLRWEAKPTYTPASLT